MARPRSSPTPNERRLYADIIVVSDLASSTNGKGASLVGVEDAGGLIAATTVEGALAENRAAIDQAEADIDAIEADYLTSSDIGSTVQALDADLTAIAALSTTAFGRAFLEETDAASTRTTLGLAAVASSGDYADLTNRPLEAIRLDVGDETTALTTGTGKLTFRMPFAFTLTDVRASVVTAPTDANLIVDINEGGTTILSTKLTIDGGEKTSTTAATAAVISDSALADDAEITIDIDQVGSTIAGAGLKVTLIGRQ